MRPRGVLLAAMLLCACAGRDDEDEHARAPARTRRGAVVLDDLARKALDLEIAPAVESDLPDVRVRYGRAIARPGDERAISSPIAGRITSATTTIIGEPIGDGTVIAVLTPQLTAPERAALGVQAADLRGQAEQAQQELLLRRQELTRAQDLAKDGIVSQAKLQEAETAVATAEAKLRALEAGRAAQAGAAGAPVTIKAPVAGTLVASDAVVGAVVEPGHVLARVLRAGPRRIEVAMGAGEATGAAYEVEVGAQWAPARLVAQGTIAGEAGRHDVLELDGTVAPAIGATVAVRVASGGTRGVIVPETAIVPSASGALVFVERPDGALAPTPIVIAARFGGRARIASGLAPGAHVVVRGVAALRGELARSSLGGDDD